MSKPTDLEFVLQEVLDHLNGVGTTTPQTLAAMVRGELCELRKCRVLVE